VILLPYPLKYLEIQVHITAPGFRLIFDAPYIYFLQEIKVCSQRDPITLLPFMIQSTGRIRSREDSHFTQNQVVKRTVRNDDQSWASSNEPCCNNGEWGGQEMTFLLQAMKCS
jgi:hypothetical protein